MNPLVHDLLASHLSTFFSVSKEEVLACFEDFTSSLLQTKRGVFRRAIIASFREVFGTCLDRYPDEDIIGWVSPYPIDNIYALSDHCSSKVSDLDLVAPSWKISERVPALSREIKARVIREITQAEVWGLAYTIKKEITYEIDIKRIVRFILDRKKSTGALDRDLIKSQALIEFS